MTVPENAINGGGKREAGANLIGATNNGAAVESCGCWRADDTEAVIAINAIHLIRRVMLVICMSDIRRPFFVFVGLDYLRAAPGQ